MNEAKQEAVNASLEEVAQMWLNIILAQIRSNKEQENLKNEHSVEITKKQTGFEKQP